MAANIYPHTNTNTLLYRLSHPNAHTILVARAGLKYSIAVTHEEKFLIINIQPIMNVLLAAVVLGA